MPTQNRASLTNKSNAAAPRRPGISRLLIVAGVVLMVLAVLMLVVVVTYRPAQAAPVEGHLEELSPPAPQPTAGPSRPPSGDPRNRATPRTRGRRELAPPPRPRTPIKAAGSPLSRPTTGRIEVSTTPGGYTLLIGGQPRGTTSPTMQLYELEPGRHTVEVQFPNNTRWVRTINIVTGKKQCITLNYRPRIIAIRHDAQSGDEVETVDPGEVSSTSDNGQPSLSLDADAHRVTLSCPGVEATAKPPRVHLKAKANNPGGQPVRYDWSVTDGGIKGDGADVVWDLSDVQPGTYTATVEMQRGPNGDLLTASKSVVVMPCRKPSTPPVGAAGMSVRPVTFSRQQVETMEMGEVQATIADCSGMMAMPGDGVPIVGTSALKHIPPPSPTPTPTPSPTPSPAPQAKEQDKIVARYPERLLRDKDSTLRVELSRVLEAVAAGTTTTVDGKVETVAKPGAIAGAVNPEGTMDDAFGAGYKAYATVTLVSNDLKTIQAPPPEQSLALDSVAWEWHVRPKDEVKETANFAFQIDVVWKGDGLPDIHRRAVWKRDCTAPIGPPTHIKVLEYGSPASGLGGGGAMAGGFIQRRRRKLSGEEGEGEDPGEGAGADPDPSEGAGADPPIILDSGVAEAATGAVRGGVVAATVSGDEVHCTAYAPPGAVPGDSFLVQVFAHLAAQSAELDARANEFDETTRRSGSKKLSQKIERGRELVFGLQMPGLEIDDPAQSLVWDGEIDFVAFGVSVPEGFKPKTVIGTVTVAVVNDDGARVPVGHLKFAFKITGGAAQAGATAATGLVAPAQSPTPPAPALQQSYVAHKRAFISYASQNRPEVEKRVQMLLAEGIECYMDVLTFKPGARWESSIYGYIDQSDIFYLFWSEAAKQSDWVRQEIEYALKKKAGNDVSPPEIKPIPIEGPPVVLPPDGLQHLHFNDPILYFIKAEEAARRQPPPKG